ncbi:alpha/beta hydrolase fold family protein [Rhodococcus sp. MTM3W5.2]|uniref:alpha/beta fold hydrolase n=1 Tax=Rhodococcus sp. MTM3W5.2 TaxID=1805827 RepID=UPI0009791BE7|nr:alpha/beta fold hydrolase [Rhodococcus sp. MTM3W5.2]AQA21273.1 alpha/beta hydrolase fold family protein [Rhodococcus sp. MTM3W5.2]
MTNSANDSHSVRPAVARTVRSGSVELAVFEQGNPTGPTLVLVHGWPDTHQLWEHVVPHLTDRFRVVSYDTRGSGRSTVPTAVADYRLEFLAQDLFAVLDAVSPDRPVHLLAHDWGSVESWQAVCEPGAERRIASYTSVSGPNLDHLGTWLRAGFSNPTPRGVYKRLTQAVASAYTVLFQTPGLGPLPFRLGMSRIWPTFLRFFDGLDPALVHPAPTLRSDMINGLKRYRANIRPKLRHPADRRTTVPVQLILSTRDRAVRPVGYEDIDRWVSDLRRREIPAGHWSPISHAADLARLTVEFVDGVIARDSGDGTAANF